VAALVKLVPVDDVRVGLVGPAARYTNQLQELDDRPRPAVAQENGQRLLVSRPHVQEMETKPVDVGTELRKGVDLGFEAAPVVNCPQYSTRRCTRSRRTPCAQPRSVSGSGHRTASSRRRRSARAASGTETWNGVTRCDTPSSECGSWLGRGARWLAHVVATSGAATAGERRVAISAAASIPESAVR
jgi:hypothetical protein